MANMKHVVAKEKLEVDQRVEPKTKQLFRFHGQSGSRNKEQKQQFCGWMIHKSSELLIGDMMQLIPSLKKV